MTRVRRDEFATIREAIDDGTQTVHISGQPGVGKSTFLDDLAEELSTEYRTRTLYVREGNSPTTLTQDLLYEVRDAVGTFRALLNKASGANVGIGPFSGGLSTDNRARDLQKLSDLSESVKAERSLILFVDDVHKLGEPDITRGYLRELSSNLGENVYVITAGRLRYEDADLNVHLNTFTSEETAEYLQLEYPEISPETIDDVYEKLDGHPYYLSLLTEAADSDVTFQIPEDDARDFTERAYLDSLSEEEEEFVRKTSGLAELDEEICSAVLDDVNRTQARRILNSLSSKAVVTELGRSEDTGDRVFKVHDLFQELLHQQLQNPDELHRRAFQYYARKLYGAVEESQAPALDGFVFGLLANIHLKEVYDGEPEIQQLREEVDRLEFSSPKRLQFMFGYAPYAPIPEGQPALLLALELDDFSTWLRDLEPENEEEELEQEILGVMMDLLRATQRSNADAEFDESALAVYQSTLERINEADLVEFFDEDEQEAAQVIPDMLRVGVHVAAYRDLSDDARREEHLAAAFDVLERYGLDRGAVEGFVNNCRELANEYEAGEQAEEMIEGQIEDLFDQYSEDDATRNTLMRMQTEVYGEVKDLAKSAFTAMVTESDRLLEFIHECGDCLEQADNPFFVAAWYSFAADVYRMFAPEADSTKELEEAAKRYTKCRMEYEEDLDSTVYEIEEFEIQNLDFPDLVDEIAETDGGG